MTSDIPGQMTMPASDANAIEPPVQVLEAKSTNDGMNTPAATDAAIGRDGPSPKPVKEKWDKAKPTKWGRHKTCVSEGNHTRLPGGTIPTWVYTAMRDEVKADFGKTMISVIRDKLEAAYAHRKPGRHASHKSEGSV